MDKLKYLNFKVLGIGLVIILALGLFINFFPKVKNKSNAQVFKSDEVIKEVVEQAIAKNVYPLFFCPCCGQPLDKNNICCGAAKERIDYIDALIDAEISEDKVILAYVKKYGLDSFIDKEKQKEFQKKLAKEAPDDRPIISLNPNSYDFGDVSQKKGKVYTYFNLKNEGKSDLVIDRLETSCGCTFVAVVFQEQESPYFTMPGHGYENPEWNGVSIPSGKTAQLKIMYDPDVHQDFRGAATREVYIYSNDPIDFQKKVIIELNQVD